MFTTQNSPSSLKFLPPVFRHSSKEKYVEYYAVFPPTGKLRRKRIKLNRIKSVTIQKKIAQQLCAEISAKLICGWNPFIDEVSPKSYYSLEETISSFLAIKRKTTEPTTIVGYESFVRMLYAWMDKNALKRDMYVCSFSPEMANEYMLSIEGAAGISYRTYGNRLRFYKILFNWMVENRFVAENPFEKIKFHKKRVAAKHRRCLTKQEQGKLLEYLTIADKWEYAAMCLICYYCFMRDKEICMLRVGDIDLKNQVIKVSAEVAKNDHTSQRTIPDAIIPYLLKLRLDAPSNYYLFGDCPHYGFYPSHKKATSRQVYNFWDRYVRTNLNWGKDLCFYSLKDTGITDLTSSGVPLNFVQGQADHSNVAITSLYLQSITPEAHEALKKVHTFNAKK